MVVLVRRQTLKDINNNMKETAHNSAYPFKILKMINGDDVICKITEEYKDAFVVEYPMSVIKNQVVENETSIVEHTGLQRWMNYTHDTSFVIPKERILSLGNLAPDVTVYYKHIRKRLEMENEFSPSNEDEAVEKMKENVERLMHIMGEGPDLPDNVIPFDGDKTKNT